MHKWCKIIEVLDNQVLFFMEPSKNPFTKEETSTLHQMVQIGGVCSDIEVRNIPKDVCDKVFDNCNEKDAEEVIKKIEDLMEKNK